MNLRGRIKKNAHVMATVFAAAALTSPLGGQQLDDDDLMPVNNGVLLMRDHSHGSDNADWMKFETDPCGFLERVQSKHSMLRQSALADGMDDFDDEPTPEEEARNMVGRWLSAHSEIAVIGDAIDKSCDTYLPDDDEELAPDVLAGWKHQTREPSIRTRSTLQIV